MENEEKTVLTKSQDETRLPGAWVVFRSALSSGSSENRYGVGEISLDLYRSDNKYPWVGLGSIFYSSPTPEQLLDAETSPEFSEGRKAFGDIKRSLSKKQAELVVRKILTMMAREFPNGIPPDDEITL